MQAKSGPSSFSLRVPNFLQLRLSSNRIKHSHDMWFSMFMKSCEKQFFLNSVCTKKIQWDFYVKWISMIKILRTTTLYRRGFGVEYVTGIREWYDGWICIPTMSAGLPGTQKGMLSITGILFILSSVGVGVVFRFFHNLVRILLKMSTKDATQTSRMNSTTTGMI